ncbi:MAG: ABC transporter substrate-binding protein [Tissierellia bacterium]|nr:ABC transporter substrate-binding protein [Tissierellia bacterium]
MRKYSRYFIFAFLIFGILLTSGCSQSAKESLEENSENQGEKSTASSGEVIEIEYWYGLGSIAGQTMEEFIEDFNNSQDKVHVTGVQQASYDETFQKVQAAIAANKPPAVFIADKDMQEMARREITAPLDDLMDERTPKDDYLDVFIEPAEINDKVYAIPAFGTTQVIYYRKDLLEKAEIDPEEMYASWENIFKYSKEIQEKEIAPYGHLIMWGPDNLVDIARSNGGQILSDDGTKVTINTPEWVDSWEFVRKQVFEDKTTKMESGGQGWEYWYRTIDNVLNGTAVSYTGSSGDKGDLDFDILDSAVQPGYGGNPGKPAASALYFTIPASASEEQQKAAFEWIAYFTSPENSAKWAEKIGYIPVRKSSMEVDSYKAYVEEHPYAVIPYQQALTALPNFDDITNGKIYDEIRKAADKVELENIPAKEALDAAQEQGQKALDEYLKSQ